MAGNESYLDSVFGAPSRGYLDDVFGGPEVEYRTRRRRIEDAAVGAAPPSDTLTNAARRYTGQSVEEPQTAPSRLRSFEDAPPPAPPLTDHSMEAVTARLDRERWQRGEADIARRNAGAEMEALVAEPQPDTAGERAGKLLRRAGDLFSETFNGWLMREAESHGPREIQTLAGGPPIQVIENEQQRLIDEARQNHNLPGQRAFEAAAADLEANGYHYRGTADYYLTNALESLVQMLPVVAAGVITRGRSVPTLGTLYEQQAGQQYGQSRMQGRSPAQASEDAAVFGLAEAIPEALPLGVLMRPGGRLLPRLLKTAGFEGASEVLTQGIEDGYSSQALNPNMTWGQAWRDMRDAGIIGGLMGAGMTGVEAPFHRDAAASSGNPEADAAARQALDPNYRPGVIEQAQSRPPNITPEDHASPLPTDLIAQGKSAIDDVLAGAQADHVLDQNIGHQTGDKVSVTIGGQERTGTIKDAFQEEDQETGTHHGAVIEWDHGGQSRERFSDLADAGARIARRPRDTGHRVANDVVEYLMRNGIREDIAHGIAAGVAAESGNDHGVRNAASGALGLGQWLGTRQAELHRRYGPNPTRQQQLEFLVWELRGGDPGGAAVLNSRNPGEALDNYIRHFMRPAAGAETTGDLARGQSALRGAGVDVGDLASTEAADAGPAPDFSWIDRPVDQAGAPESVSPIQSVAATNDNVEGDRGPAIGAAQETEAARANVLAPFMIANNQAEAEQNRASRESIHAAITDQQYQRLLALADDLEAGRIDHSTALSSIDQPILERLSASGVLGVDETKAMGVTSPNEAEGTARAGPNAPLQDLGQHAESVQQSENALLPQLRGEGDQAAPSLEQQLRDLRGERGAASESASLPGSDQQQRPLRAGERPLGDEEAAGAQYAEKQNADVPRPDAMSDGVGGRDGIGAIGTSIPPQAGRNDGRGSAIDTTPGGRGAASGLNFDPEQHVEAMRAYVANSTGSLNDTEKMGKALGLTSEQTHRVMGVLASRADSGIRMTNGRPAGTRRILLASAQTINGKKRAARYKTVTYRSAVPARFQRTSVRTAPLHFLEWVRAQGGVKSGAHDLRNVGGLANHPGVINNRTGLSLDQLGERMPEAGWSTERPTESDVLEMLTMGSTAKVYRPEDSHALADKSEAAKASADEEMLRSLNEEFGLDLSEDDLARAAEYMSQGKAPIQALTEAANDAGVDALETTAAETGDDTYLDQPEQVHGGVQQGAEGAGDRGPAEGVARPEGQPQDAQERADANAESGKIGEAPAVATDLLGDKINLPSERDAAQKAARKEYPNRVAVQEHFVRGWMAERGDEDAKATLVGSDAERDGAAAAKGVPVEKVEQTDMFGTQPGDERRALEKKAEGRQQSTATQKAPGSDGGLLDQRDTTGDMLPDATRPADVSAKAENANTSDPVETAKAALQSALDALNGKPAEAAPSAIAIYRGESATNRGGGYYSTNADWAQQFTQGGRAEEVKSASISSDDVYVADPLPLATKEDQFDAAMAAAKAAGKKAFRVDEGAGEPNSIYVFNKSAVKTPEAPVAEAAPAETPPETAPVEPPRRAGQDRSLFQRSLTEGDDPVFYSALERVVESSTTTRASAEQWSATLSKAAGVKKDELEWSGVFDWLDMQKGPVSREDLLGVVRDGGIKVEEVVLGEPIFDQFGEEDRFSDRPETQFENWSSDPNNPTYRELLITLPIAEGGNPTRDFKTHWDQLAVIAHTRFMDKRDAEGRRVLFVEEIQSDRAQAGRDRGFEKPVDPAAANVARERFEAAKETYIAAGRAAIEGHLARGEDYSMPHTYRDADTTAAINAAIRWMYEKGGIAATSDGAASLNKVDDAKAAMDLAGREYDIAQGTITGGGVPDMPFKSSWPALVMKRLIRYASDNGFDKIAWTTGAEQNERYSLENRVNSVRSRPHDATRVELYFGRDIASTLSNGGVGEYVSDNNSLLVSREETTSLFGKDLGGRIFDEGMAAPTDNPGSGPMFSGLDLRVGGEGMRGFYDRNLVNIANDLIKKYGGKVEPVTLQSSGRDLIAGKVEQPINPGFTITPQLAGAARSGFSLFQRGPSVDRRTFIKGVTAVTGGFMVGDRLFAQPPGLMSILERSINEAVPLTEPLEWIAQNSENAQFRRFAARMIPLVQGIVIRGNPVGRRTHADGTAVPEDIWAGLAHGMHQVDEVTDGDVIWLARGEWVNGFNEGTLVHEALHAALYRIFGRLSIRMAGNDPALLRREGFNREAGPRPASAAQIAELRSLYQEATTAFERKVEGMSVEENRSDGTRHIRNGLGTPDEFLSYALENRDMQAFLRQQPARGGKSAGTLWDKIVAFIRRVLGMGDTPRSALDDVLDTGYRLLADPQGPAREPNQVVEDSTAAELTRGDTTGRSALQRAREYAFENPETEKRWQDARKGIGAGEGVIAKSKAVWQAVAAGFSRHFKYLPNEPRFSDLQQQFRKLETVPDVAKDETVRRLRNVVGKMTKAEYDLFARKVVVDDLEYEIAHGHDLPFGLNSETLPAEKARIDAEIAANPKLSEALETRRSQNKEITDELVAEGVLSRDQVANPAYFRHMVLDYARAERNFARGAGSKVTSPWWAKRAGSNLDINANFLEAEADWMLKAMVDIQTAKTIRFIKESDHNIRNDLRDQARAKNKEAMDGIIADNPDLGELEASYRQKIAIGLEKVRAAVESATPGMPPLIVPEHLRAAAESIRSKSPRDESIFPLLSWMLDNNKPGADGAAMTLKAISQRKAWAKSLLGEKYINPDDVKSLAKRLAPEGHVAWQPSEGRHLFTAKTMPEHVIDRLINSLADTQLPGIPRAEMELALQAIRPQLVVGGDRYTMVIPKEVADTLDEFGDAHADGVVGRAFSFVNGSWKQWALINLRRFFKYNLNNQLGDVDAVIAGHPATFRKMGQATKEIWQVMVKGAEPSARYKEALERGVFTSGLSFQEIPDINRLSALKHLTDERSNRPDKLVLNAAGKVWRSLQGATNFRETLLRYAAYLSYVEKMEAGQPLEQIGYGASLKNMVDAVADPKDRAALMARDLLGDYGGISVAGGWLRKYLVPFWSWKELNTKRYWRLTGNAFRESKAKGIATGGALGAGIAVRTGVGLTIRMAMVYGLIQLWNHLLFGDDEDKLSDQQKRQLHILLGRDSDGQIVSLRAQGALSDVLGELGFPDAITGLRRAEAEQGTYTQAFTDTLKAPVNQLTSVTPIINEPLEQAMGYEFWPDLFNPRPIRDRWRHLFSTFSLENEYDVAADRPSRGYAHSWTEAFVYRRDPGEMAYDTIRGMTYDWNQNVRGEGGTINRTDPKSSALRDYRMALRYGDQERAQEALQEYRRYDGTSRGLHASIARADPLGAIPRRFRRQFLATLSDDQRETLMDAEAWYHENYLRQHQPQR